MKARRLIFFLLLLCLSGCTKIPLDSENEVASIVERRIGTEVQWKSNFEDPQIQAYIDHLVSCPLTPESAVQIALLNNPHIQATFEELGIAQADLVEAGLFSNPVFEIEVRYPHQKRLRTNIEYLVTATFLDIFLVPLRKRVAAAEFEQAKLKVANEILDLTFEVRQTYYELISEQQKLQDTLAITGLMNIQEEIIARQHNVNNVNQLDLQQAQSRFLEAKVASAKFQNEIIHLTEKLHRLLGLKEEICFIFPEEFEETNYDGFDQCLLESVALTERLDLQIARFEVVRLARMLGLKNWWAYTNFKAGVAGERDPDGANLLGFGVGGEIPIFNYGQASRMRLFAMLRQARDRLEELEIKVLSEVRATHNALLNDLNVVMTYQTEILPLQKRILQSSEELYNVMGLGIDMLLENKHQELIMHRNYVESKKNYQNARIQLDRALGGHLFRLMPQNDCGNGVSK